MKAKSIVNRLAAVVLALSGAAATATTVYQFEVTGDYSATWQLTAAMLPDDSFDGQQFTIWNIVGSFDNASTSKVDLTFFNGADGGGFNIYDFAARVNLLSTDGPQLYTGAESSPTFASGTFSLTQYQGAGRYSLAVTEVTAVPEPATMVLALGGLLGVAAVSRKRLSLSIAASAALANDSPTLLI